MKRYRPALSAALKVGRTLANVFVSSLYAELRTCSLAYFTIAFFVVPSLIFSMFKPFVGLPIRRPLVS